MQHILCTRDTRLAPDGVTTALATTVSGARMPSRRRLSGIVALPLLLAAGCYAREPATPSAAPCLRPAVDTTGWQLARLGNVAATMRLPAELGRGSSVGEFSFESWSGPAISIITEVTADTSGLPPITSEGVPCSDRVPGFACTRPRQRRECATTIDGRLARVTTYVETSAAAGVGDPYVVLASLRLPDGRWLRMSGKTTSRAAQEEVLAAVHTFHAISVTAIAPPADAAPTEFARASRLRARR